MENNLISKTSPKFEHFGIMENFLEKIFLYNSKLMLVNNINPDGKTFTCIDKLANPSEFSFEQIKEIFEQMYK